MKIAIIYNQDSQAVINLFGIPNLEKYGLQTIKMISEALEEGGYQVKAFEGDKNIIYALEEYMPTVISGERTGLVFNLSYGIQGRDRYTHIPGILEMLGIPYVGSSPATHAIALDKVLTKMILLQKGLPTPRFVVLEKPDFDISEVEGMHFPLIVKPRDGAVSFGLKVVGDEKELREGVAVIYETFKASTLVEEYIEGSEVNVGLLGNNPVEAFPPVEIIFNEGEQIHTYEDKVKISGRNLESICPAPLKPALTKKVQALAISAFEALGCFDSARVDFRIDSSGNPYILEVNSMASLRPNGSYVYAAKIFGYEYNALVNRLIEVTSMRYFGSLNQEEMLPQLRKEPMKAVFSYLTQKRDLIEEDLKGWINLPSWTSDPVGLGAVANRLEHRLEALGMKPVGEYSSRRSTWTWQTKAGFAGGVLLVASIDVPREVGTGYTIPFRRDPEWLFGEGIASSRAGVTCILQALNALESVEKLSSCKLGVFICADEGRGMRYSSKYLRKAAAEASSVLVMQPGFRSGKVVNQRRGFRKFKILVEGEVQRIGSRHTSLDLMTWFLIRAEMIPSLSCPEDRMTVAVQEIKSESYSVLLSHRVRATVYITFLDADLADRAEDLLRELFATTQEEEFNISAYVERLEERPPLNPSEGGEQIIERLRKISDNWHMPFGVEASLLPSAAGEVPQGVPVVCGFGPASRGMFTPYESIHRVELLQRVLLLSLFLLEG